MNRREFLKSALTVAAFAPVTRIAAREGADGNKTSDVTQGAQVTRRRYKNSALTVPLLGFGCMRLPLLAPDKPEIDRVTAKKMIDLAMKAGYSTATENIRSLGFGAGMGLPNMKKYSDEMRIDSTVGVGTTVYLRVNV